MFFSLFMSLSAAINPAPAPCPVTPPAIVVPAADPQDNVAIAIMPVMFDGSVTFNDDMNADVLRRVVYDALAGNLLSKKHYSIADQASVEQAIRTYAFGGLEQNPNSEIACKAAQSVGATLALMCTVYKAGVDVPLTLKVVILKADSKSEIFRGTGKALSKVAPEIGLEGAVEMALKKLAVNKE